MPFVSGSCRKYSVAFVEFDKIGRRKVSLCPLAREWAIVSPFHFVSYDSLSKHPASSNDGLFRRIILLSHHYDASDEILIDCSMDSASLELLQLAAAQVKSIMFVVTTRPILG